jgi:hypothetical protein
MSRIRRVVLATAIAAAAIAVPFALTPAAHADVPQAYYKCANGPVPGPGFTVDYLEPVVRGSDCKVNPRGTANYIVFTSKRSPVYYKCASVQFPRELGMVMGQSCRRQR